MSRMERTRPSAGNTLRSASRSMWAWPSVMPGMTALPSRSTTRVAGPVCAAIAASGPTARIRSPETAIACAIVKAASTVMTLPFLSTRSAGPIAARAPGATARVCPCAATDRPPASMPAVPAAPAAFRNRRRGMVSSNGSPPALGEIGDRVRRLVVFLAEIRFDVLAIGGGQTGVADHLPCGHVAVAAVDRVGEEALHCNLQECIHEHGAGEARELGFSLLHCLQRRRALRLGEPVEVFAVGLARPVVGGGNAGAEELARRERELIAEFRLALGKRAVAIEPRTAAIGTGELAIDEGRDSALAAGGRKLVGRDDRVRGGSEESVLRRGESEQRLGRGGR